jgi:adenosine 3'-phospho 5'-phosphosulfate transporter B3
VLGYLEVLGVAVCSYFERLYHGETTRKASWTSYFMLCFCLLISSATSNIALSYINYPTKVVFRSCKLIPTMLIAVSYNKKKVQWFEFMWGSFISLGMVFFAVADFQVYPTFDFVGKSGFVSLDPVYSSTPLMPRVNPSIVHIPPLAVAGIILVCISVIADAFLPNFQERVFDQGSSRLEVTFFTNILCLGAMTVGFTASGDLPAALSYALANPYALSLMAVYTFLAYIAITFHMALVKEFGGIVTVLVGNARKAMTIVLSFILFPKPTSYLYAVGGFLVFGSLVGNGYMKERHSNSKS